ncbi:hypothetical protein HHK36_027627 [Tetracentron sinense]|uniref:Large ribosomal subunit protein bL25 beta domain-containing protein n=1 Tax=Tetracentron sinense TaxID=13715 RepID=A0A834YF56_TETSI|nr:hypothetical protein HHK36_027627 [Tetracentron sinense]
MRAYLNTIKRTVRYLCPADVVPPYIDVDLSELDVGQKLVMGDLKGSATTMSYQLNVACRLDRDFGLPFLFVAV